MPFLAVLAALTRIKTTAVCLALLLSLAGVARADFIFSGTLDPATNSNLTYWDQSTGMYVPPIAGPGDFDRAFNVAVHTFSVIVAEPVTIASQGYGLGGFDSVVSVFEGTGPTAVYLDHRYNLSAPGNFDFMLNLTPGDYTLAVSMFLNEPCASGVCVGVIPPGTFGDGFGNLVTYDAFSSLYYEVAVTATPIPEPAYTGLLVTGIIALLARKRLLVKR